MAYACIFAFWTNAEGISINDIFKRNACIPIFGKCYRSTIPLWTILYHIESLHIYYVLVSLLQIEIEMHPNAGGFKSIFCRSHSAHSHLKNTWLRKFGLHSGFRSDRNISSDRFWCGLTFRSFCELFCSRCVCTIFQSEWCVACSKNSTNFFLFVKYVMCFNFIGRYQLAARLDGCPRLCYSVCSRASNKCDDDRLAGRSAFF